MNDVFCRSLVVGFSFFLSIKKEKKEERRAEKIFGRKKSEKSSPSQRGFCVSYERIDEFKLSSFF